jgi:hypothetical protein
VNNLEERIRGEATFYGRIVARRVCSYNYIKSEAPERDIGFFYSARRRGYAMCISRVTVV